MVYSKMLIVTVCILESSLAQSAWNSFCIGVLISKMPLSIGLSAKYHSTESARFTTIIGIDNAIKVRRTYIVKNNPNDNFTCLVLKFVITTTHHAA